MPYYRCRTCKRTGRITSQIVILSLFVNASAVFCKYGITPHVMKSPRRSIIARIIKGQSGSGHTPINFRGSSPLDRYWCAAVALLRGGVPEPKPCSHSQTTHRQPLYTYLRCWVSRSVGGGRRWRCRRRRQRPQLLVAMVRQRPHRHRRPSTGDRHGTSATRASDATSCPSWACATCR
jgi:hypothetical protein